MPDDDEITAILEEARKSEEAAKAILAQKEKSAAEAQRRRKYEEALELRRKAAEKLKKAQEQALETEAPASPSGSTISRMSAKGAAPGKCAKNAWALLPLPYKVGQGSMKMWPRRQTVS